MLTNNQTIDTALITKAIDQVSCLVLKNKSSCSILLEFKKFNNIQIIKSIKSGTLSNQDTRHNCCSSSQTKIFFLPQLSYLTSAKEKIVINNIRIIK